MPDRELIELLKNLLSDFRKEFTSEMKEIRHDVTLLKEDIASLKTRVIIISSIISLLGASLFKFAVDYIVRKGIQ